MKNIEGKGEIARNEQFLLFPQYFSCYRIDQLPSILITSKIVVSHSLDLLQSENFWPDIGLSVRIIRDLTQPTNYQLAAKDRRAK